VGKIPLKSTTYVIPSVSGGFAESS
jgi:hypothetical protein